MAGRTQATIAEGARGRGSGCRLQKQLADLLRRVLEMNSLAEPQISPRSPMGQRQLMIFLGVLNHSLNLVT